MENNSVINKYESVFVLNVTRSDEQIKESVEKFKKLISENGTVEEVEEWGIRKLAYPINHQNNGYYVLVKFSAKPEFPKELERIYRISDDVIRYLVVKIEEPKKAQTMRDLKAAKLEKQRQRILAQEAAEAEAAENAKIIEDSANLETEPEA